VTVTVTLHDPVLTPLSVVPDTLQYFEELAMTFSETFEVESTLSLAKAAIDFVETGLDSVTLGVVTDVEVDPMATTPGGLRVSEVGVAVEVLGDTSAGED
jgi:predicted thioesterase